MIGAGIFLGRRSVDLFFFWTFYNDIIKIVWQSRAKYSEITFQKLFPRLPPVAACSCQIAPEEDSRENYEQTFGKLFPGTFCAQQENTKSQNILGSVPTPAKILKRQLDKNYSSKVKQSNMRDTETTTSILCRADIIFFVNCSRTEILIIFWRKNYRTALFSPLADFLTIIDPTSREVTEIFPNMRNKLVPSFFNLPCYWSNLRSYILSTVYDNSGTLETLVRSASFCRDAKRPTLM